MSHIHEVLLRQALNYKFNGITSIEDTIAGIRSGSILKERPDGTLYSPAELEAELIAEQKGKNACSMLPGPLSNRLDNALSVLKMTKGDFLREAIISALDQFDEIADKYDIYHYYNENAEASKESK